MQGSFFPPILYQIFTNLSLWKRGSHLLEWTFFSLPLAKQLLKHPISLYGELITPEVKCSAPPLSYFVHYMYLHTYIYHIYTGICIKIIPRSTDEDISIRDDDDDARSKTGFSWGNCRRNQGAGSFLRRIKGVVIFMRENFAYSRTTHSW